jgi:hypothetical protein
MSVTVFYNRKTGEAFAVDNVAEFRRTVFESGARDEKDFDMASSSGCVQIRPMLKSGMWFGVDITTIDSESML